MRPKKTFWVAALLLACAVFAGCADKKAAENLYIKALERYEQKDLKSADAFIHQCLECDKKNERAKFLKAKINFFQGRYGAAAEILLDLTKTNSDHKDIQLYLINSLILQKRYDLAREQIEAARKNDRGDWRLCRLMAIVAAKTDDTEACLGALNEALLALEGSSEIYYDLSKLWQSLGVKSKAEEFKQKCLVLDKDKENFF